MKSRLDQLTIAQFIDLICGDSSVLVDKDDKPSDVSLTLAMRNIVFEYKEIADPTGMKTYLNEIEDLIKAKIANVVFSMCSNLIRLKEYERAKTILSDYGIKADKMSDQRIEAEVKSRLARAQKVIADFEVEQKDDDIDKSVIRKDFDAQTAALMAYFKFQIDQSTMKASVYAHLIARHIRELKSQIAASKKI